MTAQRRSAADRAARPVLRAPRVARIVPARFRPSARSLIVGLALAALAVGAYATARQTSLFAIGRIEIVGGSPEVKQQVRRALAPVVGTSLLALDAGSLERRVESLPTVIAVGYDRAFPHTLRLTIVPETPVAVLHRGTETWLLSGRGRVVVRIPPRTLPGLPRIWVPKATPVAAGEFVEPAGVGSAARALALARGVHFPARIATAAIIHQELLLRLRSGLELRLGQASDVRLKLAVARRALRGLPSGAAYLDVSVPGRPVGGTEPSSLK